MIPQKIEPKYRANVDRLAATFPGAYAFLDRIERHGHAHALALSTATNAHIYKHNSFLAYFGIKHPDQKPPSLLVSPKFNRQIAAASVDRSGLLFPSPLMDVVRGQGGFDAKWACTAAAGAVEFTTRTPDAVWGDLWQLLIGLNVPR